jgi:hypothetical protein
MIHVLLAAAAALSPIQFMAGEWRGATQGKPGKSSEATRTCELILDGRYLHCRTKAVYPQQAANPKGETHQDWAIFSFDRSRKKIVMRQFHVEGFVNQYSADDKLVFESEAIENIPPGWRARESYRIVNGNEFIETFELAEPGKDFEVYSEGRYRRVSSGTRPPAR